MRTGEGEGSNAAGIAGWGSQPSILAAPGRLPSPHNSNPKRGRSAIISLIAFIKREEGGPPLSITRRMVERGGTERVFSSAMPGWGNYLNFRTSPI
jgi:hypothetical protein